MQSAVDAQESPGTVSVPRRALYMGYLQSLSAEDLVRQCHHRDPTALDVLMRCCEAPAFRLAYRLTGNREDAHDITQEALLRIWGALGALRDSMMLSGWIQQIVRNIAVDRYCRDCRQATVSLDNLSEGQREAVLERAGYLAPSAHTCVEEQEQRARLDRLIDTLPDVLRRTLSLYCHHGRSYQEIAQILEVSLGTVRSRIHRGRRALGERLASEGAAFMD